jgi:hypothetical protein
MPRVDFFNFFRYLLGTIVTVYATVLTLQWAWEWAGWLGGRERYVSLLRRYLLVHALRLRFKTFWGDVIICLLLCVVFGLLWHAHHVLSDIGEKLHDVR